MDLFDWIHYIELIINREGNSIVVSFRWRSEATQIVFQDEQGKDITMLTLTDTQKSVLTLAIKDAKGRPAKTDGIPEWVSSNVDVATVGDIAANGMSATVRAVAPGVCQITVTADADLGAGTKHITGFLDVDVAGGEAVTVELTAGPAEEQ